MKAIKITNRELNVMYNILTSNLKNIFQNFKYNESDKQLWMNSVKQKNYDFILIYDNGNVVAYLEYYKKDNIYYLSDIEIDEEHKGDKKSFKTLISEFYKKIPLNSKICCFINDENKKSLDVFNHIGLIKLQDKKYQILFDNIKNYVEDKQ